MVEAITCRRGESLFEYPCHKQGQSIGYDRLATVLLARKKIFEINLGAFRQRMISSEMMSTISAALQKAKDSGLGTCDQHVTQAEPGTVNNIAAPYSQKRDR